MITAANKLYNTFNITPIQVVTVIPQTRRDNTKSSNSELTDQKKTSFASQLEAAVNELQAADELHSRADETFTYNAKSQLQPFFYIPNRVYSV